LNSACSYGEWNLEETTMPAPYRVRLLDAFETSLTLLVLVGQGTVLLSVLGFAAGVDVTPGLTAATAGLFA
jgi:hypothetical protein